MADLSDVAVALTSLKPIGQWFLAHSVVSVALAWLFHDQAFNAWPNPARWALFAWFYASMALAGMLAANGMATLLYERRRSKTDGSDSPVAPRPPPPAPRSTVADEERPRAEDGVVREKS